MWQRFRDLTIKKHLAYTYIFTIIATSVILIVFFSAVLYTLNNNVKTNSYNILLNQVQTNSQILVSEYSEEIEGYLKQNIQLTLLEQHFIFTDSYRSPYYSLAYIQSYPDNKLSDLAQPLNSNSQSLEHSSYYIKGFLPDGSNIASLTQQNYLLVNKSAYLDEIFRPTYEYNADFLSFYIAFENGLYRHYPGMSTLNTDPQRLYDPRVQDWYIGAKRTTNHSDIFSDIYFTNSLPVPADDSSRATPNANSNTGIIQISKPIYINDVFIGVIGADLSLNTIQQNVQNINVKNGQAYLINSNGITIASTNSTINLAGNNLVTNQSCFNSNFDLIISVPLDKINEPIDSTINVINSQNNNLFAILVAICVGIAIIEYCLAMHTINKLVTPIVKICNDTDKIAHNIGNEDIFAGIDVKEPVEGIGQFYDLRKQFNEMINKAKTERGSDGPAENPLYKTFNPQIVPTAPPPSYDHIDH